MASLQKLNTGRYRVAWHVTCRYGRDYGRVFRGSMTFQDRTTARDFAARLEREEDKWRSGLAIPATGLTSSWDELLKKFFSSQKTLSGRTKEFYGEVFKKFRLHFKSDDLGKLTERTIRQFLAGLDSASTHNNHLTAMRSLLGFAADHGLIPTSPADKVAYAKIGDVQKMPPTRKQLADLLRECPRYLRYRILLLAHTGLRISEALSLKPENILEDRIVVVGKGGKRRSIPLDNIARLSLGKLGVPVYHKTDAQSRKEWAWLLSKYSHKQGLGALGPHLLRHWFGTQLAESGVDMGRIARIFGHSSVNLTYKVYIHYSDITALNRGHRLHWRKWFGG